MGSHQRGWNSVKSQRSRLQEVGASRLSGEIKAKPARTPSKSPLWETAKLRSSPWLCGSSWSIARGWDTEAALFV